MAENVHFHMEAMLPCLSEWERRHIFTKAEVKDIIRKRTSMEYQLARRISKKADYMKCIEYELELQEQFVKRRALLQKNAEQLKDVKKRDNALKELSKPRDSDIAIIKRIHGLYERCLKKFASEPLLWLQYMEWSRRVRSTKKLGELSARAIQRHPHFIQFWLLAANYEQEILHNTTSARVLLQRAIRVNPDQPKLYIEYFKLELLYVKRLKQRRTLLFGKRSLQLNEQLPEQLSKDSDSDSDSDCQSYDGVDLPILAEESAVEKQELEEVEENKKQQRRAVLKDQAQVEFFAASIPRAIVKDAFEKFPHNLDIRLAFLQLYEIFDDEFSDAIRDIYQDLRDNFAANAKARCLLALYKVSQVNSKQERDYVEPVREAIAEISMEIEQQHSFCKKYELWEACIEIARQWAARFSAWSSVFKQMQVKLRTVFEAAVAFLTDNLDSKSLSKNDYEDGILLWAKNCDLVKIPADHILLKASKRLCHESVKVLLARVSNCKKTKTRHSLLKANMATIVRGAPSSEAVLFWKAFAELIRNSDSIEPICEGWECCISKANTSGDAVARDEMAVMYVSFITSRVPLMAAATRLNSCFKMWLLAAPRVLASLVGYFAPKVECAKTSMFGFKDSVSPLVALVREWYNGLMSSGNLQKLSFSMIDVYLSCISFEMCIVGDMSQVSLLYEKGRSDKKLSNVEFSSMYQRFKQEQEFYAINV